jgi:hypothetical protein
MPAKTKAVGTCHTVLSVHSQLKEIVTEYKALYLEWLYAPTLLPEPFKTFDDLKNHYKMFPQTVTEEEAKRWLYEPPVQEGLKIILKSQHNQKMVELYKIYYEKAKEDTNAFKAFVEFSNQFFGNENKENELTAILKGVSLDE